uniref:DNA-directed RNA polymerases I and III subunit RPAC2 n=2 Tax=Oryzias TaxID=8089 RepID=A0A3P9JC63_ORYLA
MNNNSMALATLSFPACESKQRGKITKPILCSASDVKSMAGDGEKKPKLEMVQADGAQEDCVTFVMHDEDHTLGNSLRYMIMKNPDVEFCGYTITHPSESKINFRIQTRGGVPAVEPLQKGLSDLHQVCQHVLNTFQAKVNEYKEREEKPME